MSTRSARYSSVGLRAPKGRFGSGTDKDAAAFLEAAQIIDSTQERAIYNLVRNLKQAGLWTKMKAIYPFIGGTAASHKWNLKDPRDLDAAFRLVFYGGITHSATGAKANGTNGYADTFIRTNPDLTQNSTHLSYYSREDIAENSQEFSAYSGGNNNTGLVLRYADNRSGSQLYSAAAGNIILITDMINSKGFFVGSRTNVTTHKFFFNGVQRGATATDAFPLYAGNTAKISLFARNVGDSYRELWGRHECAFASAGDGLTDAEVATLTRIVQRYQIALNRAVDSDAEQFISAAAITNQVQKDAILQLVLRLKSTGIWDKMRAIYPFVGGTAAAHKFNLKNPQDTNTAYRLTFYGGWTHSSNGAVGNGTNAYADTFFVASTAPLALYDGHLSYYSRTSAYPATSGQYFLGVGSNTGFWNNLEYWGLIANAPVGSKEILGIQHSSLLSTDFAKWTDTIPDRAAYWVQSRKNINGTSLKVFKNGAVMSTATTSSAGQALNTWSIFLAAFRNMTTSPPYAQFYSTAQCAFASIGEGLDDLQVSDLYNIVEQYQVSLGRSINPPVDADADAFISAATITDPTQQLAIKNLVGQLKRFDLWSKMKAIYPFIGGTAASHKWNLKDPRDLDAAYRLVFYGGWTHSATGALGNGTNAYADTYFIASNAGLALYDGHLSYYNRNSTAPTKSESYIGVGSNTVNWVGKEMWMIWHDQATNPDTMIAMQHTSTGTFGNDHGAAFATNTRTGLWMQSRLTSDPTTLKIFNNGTALANATSNISGQAVNTRSIFINAWNNFTAGFPYAQNFCINECSFASIGNGLSNTDAANLYTIVQQYQTTLGRQV